MTELLHNGWKVRDFKNLTPDESLPDALLEVLAMESMNAHDTLIARKAGNCLYTISIQRDGEAFSRVHYALLDKEKMG